MFALECSHALHTHTRTRKDIVINFIGPHDYWRACASCAFHVLGIRMGWRDGGHGTTALLALALFISNFHSTVYEFHTRTHHTALVWDVVISRRCGGGTKRRSGEQKLHKKDTHCLGCIRASRVGRVYGRAFPKDVVVNCDSVCFVKYIDGLIQRILYTLPKSFLESNGIILYTTIYYVFL